MRAARARLPSRPSGARTPTPPPSGSPLGATAETAGQRGELETGATRTANSEAAARKREALSHAPLPEAATPYGFGASTHSCSPAVGRFHWSARQVPGSRTPRHPTGNAQDCVPGHASGFTKPLYKRSETTTAIPLLEPLNVSARVRVRLRYGPVRGLPPVASAGQPSPWLACPAVARPRGSGKPRVSEGWCGRGDSNPHALASASPSSWCVCQFRHFRNEGEHDDRLLLDRRGGRRCRRCRRRGLARRVSSTPLTTELGPFCHAIASPIDPSMNSTARIVVARVSSVAPVRAPNAV